MKRTHILKRIAWSASAASVAFLANPLQAEWQLITDFSTETPETFPVWKRFAPDGDIYFDDVDEKNASNRALYMDTGPPNENRGNIIHAAYPVPDGGVANDASCTLKFDFYAYGSAMQFLMGLSDVEIAVDDSLSVDFGQLTAPSGWADYESVVRAQTTFDARDGNQYLQSDVLVPVKEWMTIYQYVDNATDTYEIFYQRQSDAEPVHLVIDGQSQFIFRNGTDLPLTSIFLAANRGTGDATPDIWVVDNIYIDMDGRNPELPAPAVTGDSFGIPWRIDGWVDTGNWFGWVFASSDPYFYQLDLDTWFYANEGAVDLENGGWCFLFYEGQTWTDWTVGTDGWVDTGEYMGWLFEAGGGIYYSLTLDRWLVMPNPTAATGGIWAFIFPFEEPTPEGDYFISAATVQPVIDGVLATGEWDEANMYELTYESLVATGIGTSQQGLTTGTIGANAYITATAQGLYLGFDVTDDDFFISQEFGEAGNNQDGVQVGIDMNGAAEARVSTVLFDVNPASMQDGSPTGPASVFARWGAAGYDVTWGVQASAEVSDGGYTVEMMVPWAFLNSLGYENDLTVASQLRLTFALVDRDATGAGVDILWDAGAGTFAIGNPVNYPVAVIAEELVKTQFAYAIPKGSTAPTIDGVIGDGEWDKSEYIAATYDNWVARGGGTSKYDADNGTTNPDLTRAEGDIYMMATDEALYFVAEIADATPYITAEFGNASNNNDGVQLCISMNPDPGTTDRTTSVIWDFTAATIVDGALTGPANIFGRWGVPAFDPEWGIEAAGVHTETGYVIEVKMPWQVMLDTGFDNPLDAGSIISIGYIVVDFDEGTAVDLLTDTGEGTFAVGNTELWNDGVIDE